MRNDLRMHDNAVLHWAARQKVKKEVLPVYCFDPRFYEDKQTKYDIKKCGLIRTRFHMEACDSFRANLRKTGSDLFVQHAKPEDVLPNLISKDEKVHTTIVYQ
jgi:deoxyribodipyrimidine photo-lyase